MILDKLENACNYLSLHPKFKEAFQFLNRPGIKEFAFQSYSLDDKVLYALLSNKQGKKKDEAKLETHKKYIDIQFLIEGEELIGWKAAKDCEKVDKAYSEENDIEFFSDIPQTFIKLTAGTFAIFYPEDAHAPMISDSLIHKVVLKVKL
jgi:biofilm protein TabA